MIVRWSYPALEDLRTVYNYIAEKGNLDAAAALVDYLIEAEGRLGTFPQLGRAGRLKGTRELIVPPFVFVYRVGAMSEVTISSVIHGSRRL